VQRRALVDRVAEGLAVAPVGGDDVEDAVAVDVAELEVADALVIARPDVLAGEDVAALVDQDVALADVVDADDEVGVAVVVEVAGLDHVGVVRLLEHPGLLGEAGPAVVDQQLVELGVLDAAGVSAGAVGEHDVDEAVAVDVDQLDLLRDVPGVGELDLGVDLPRRRARDRRHERRRQGRHDHETPRQSWATRRGLQPRGAVKLGLRQTDEQHHV
jgi:hypothetical protein